MCHRDLTTLQTTYLILIEILGPWGLQVATEKVQISEIVLFLGLAIYPKKIVPQKLEIRRDHLHTFNDF